MSMPLTDWSRRFGLDDLEQFLDPTPPPPVANTAHRSVPYIGPERPGDAFNARHTGGEILSRLGFALHRRDRSGDEHYTRPGKDHRRGTASATVYADDGHTTIWSDTCASVWPALDTRRPYDPFGLYVVTSHGGDFTAAREELGRQGYGAPWQPDDLSWAVPAPFVVPGEEPSHPEPGEPEGTGTIWPEPEPLEPELTHGPPFPVEVLPAWMADMAIEVAEAKLVPVDLPAVAMLGALSTVVQTKATVHVEGTGWTEDTNLYLMCAYPSGGGKSPAFDAAMAPIETFEEARIRELSAEIDEATTRFEILSKKAKDKQESAAKGSIDVEEAVAARAEASAIVIPPSPAFIAEDATPEALGQHIADCGGRAALLSAEGDPVDMMGGQYAEKGKGANLGVYLKSWGGESIRVKRVGRGVVRLPKSTLVVCVMPQPILLRRLGENAELGERGITARFLYSVPPTNVGWRDYEALRRPAGTQIHEAYEVELLGIANRLARCAYPMTLRTSAAVTQMWIDWLNSTEVRLRPGGDLEGMAGWVAKLRGSTLRIAALLHVAEGRGQSDEVDVDILGRAIALADYWIAHYKTVHAVWAVGSDPVNQRARKIIEWVVRDEVTEFSGRDLQLKQRRSFEAIEDAVEPLTWLIEAGWLRAESGLPVKVGQRGKPSPRFIVRPDVADWWTHGAQLSHGAQPAGPESGEVARHSYMRAETHPIARPCEVREKGVFQNIHTYTNNQHQALAPESPQTDEALRATTHGAQQAHETQLPQASPQPVAEPAAPSESDDVVDDDEYGPDWSLV